MRSIALMASVGLILIHRDERGPWFWVGVALLVLNLLGFLTTRSQAAARGGAREDARSHRLEELLFLPGVAAAFASGPELWRQVSYLDDTRFEPTTAAELAAFVWIEDDQGWTIGLGDEVKPYVDLDIDEADDPVISVLEAHPAVKEAAHEDREVYRVEQRQPIGTEEFAELAARALVSHHVQAAARL
jgi:hypothetical protein